jgi:hypothetical protein
MVRDEEARRTTRDSERLFSFSEPEAVQKPTVD